MVIPHYSQIRFDKSFTKFLSATLEGGHKILSGATLSNVIEGHRSYGKILWFGDHSDIFSRSPIYDVTITLEKSNDLL